MNERIIQGLLLPFVMHEKNHVLAVPNSQYLLNGEADMLSVTRAGFVHEYEIKCSRSDYMAEFRPHTKKWKHINLSRPISPNGSTPNYFWFVTHGFEIDPPEYAGWIAVVEWSGGAQLKVNKRAPRLHSDKWPSEKYKKAARLLTYRLLKFYAPPC